MQMMDAADRGRYISCLEIAAKMKKEGVSPDYSTYSALIRAAARESAWLDAWAIFDDMLLLGFKPTTAIFNHLLHAQRHRSSLSLWPVIRKMNEMNIAPNSSTFSYIIHRYTSDNNLEVALQYLYAMKAHKLVPELPAIEAVVTLAAHRGYPRLAIDLATWFEDSSIRRLDHAVWMSCLRSSTDSLYVDGVLHCWKIAVQDLNLTPDEGLCVLVLHTAGRHGLPDLATDVLRVLKLIGVSWEEHHFAPLIEAFCRADQIKEALQTLEIMQTKQIEPITETAYPLLEIVRRDTDAVDVVWAIIDELHKQGKRIHISVINVLIQASVALGDLQRAVGAYKSLVEYGLTPGLTTFNLLFQGCVVASHRELGGLLLADMKEAKITPDEETYQQFISLCLTQDDYEDAFFYLEEMKAAGHIPSSSVYVSIIRKCLSAGDSRYTVAEEEMRQTGYLMPSDLKREMQDAVYQAEKPRNDPSPPVEGEAVGIDGAAQRFIETGGLAGSEELAKAPGTYAQG